MPLAPLKPCASPGCRELTDKGRCPAHTRQSNIDRGSARQRGYTSAWDKAAGTFKRHRPLCLGCEAVGQVTATYLVDHVEPHRGDMVKFWDTSMWQPSCEWHHNVIKKQLEYLFDRGQLTAADLRLDSAAAIRLTREAQG